MLTEMQRQRHTETCRRSKRHENTNSADRCQTKRQAHKSRLKGLQTDILQRYRHIDIQRDRNAQFVMHAKLDQGSLTEGEGSLQ
jgi:hypothetical protein